MTAIARIRNAAVDYRVSETIKATRRSWALTPLRGKVPLLMGWQNAPRPSEAQVHRWAQAGNVGLRTGAVSGVVVIDVDSVKGGDASPLRLPRTVTVITGSGGRHLYFRHPGGRVRNSVGKLSPHIDVRGDGGQVVFVGSVHPDTGNVYRWGAGRSPEDVEVADLPEHILCALRPPPRASFEDFGNIERTISTAFKGTGSGTRFASAELNRQVQAVHLAPVGVRNLTLNVAAFRLGRLVARGLLHEQEVSLRLEWAASACGLSARAAHATIRSGLSAGQRKCRP